MKKNFVKVSIFTLVLIVSLSIAVSFANTGNVIKELHSAKGDVFVTAAKDKYDSQEMTVDYTLQVPGALIIQQVGPGSVTLNGQEIKAYKTKVVSEKEGTLVLQDHFKATKDDKGELNYSPGVFAAYKNMPMQIKVKENKGTNNKFTVTGITQNENEFMIKYQASDKKSFLANEAGGVKIRIDNSIVRPFLVTANFDDEMNLNSGSIYFNYDKPQLLNEFEIEINSVGYIVDGFTE